MAKKKGNNYIIDTENNIAKIELNRTKAENLWAIIDLEDLQRVLDFPYTWFAKYDPDIDSFYAVASQYHKELGRARPVYLHQFVMDANGKVVDHENHDTLDDRKSNLRISEEIRNARNRKGRNKNNKSGFRNVCWSKSENKWVVQLQIDGENTRFGRFAYEDLDKAGKLAEELRQKYYGEFAGAN